MERPNAGQEEVRSASNCCEGRQALDFFSDLSLGAGHVERAILCSEDGIALIAQFVKIRVIHPDVHGKFELANEAGATDKGRDPTLHAVFRSSFGKGRTVRASAANH